MNRKQILQELEDLMNGYCDGCFLHELNKTDKGRRFAHRFCITQCTIGEKIKNYGKQLISSQI